MERRRRQLRGNILQAHRRLHGTQASSAASRAHLVRRASSQLAALVKRYLEESDRDPDEFTISKRLYLAIDDDESRAERRLREWFGQYYGRADMANEVAIWGSAGRVVERIEAIMETGASHILLNPVFDLEEHLEQLAELTGLANR